MSDDNEIAMQEASLEGAIGRAILKAQQRGSELERETATARIIENLMQGRAPEKHYRINAEDGTRINVQLDSLDPETIKRVGLEVLEAIMTVDDKNQMTIDPDKLVTVISEANEELKTLVEASSEVVSSESPATEPESGLPTCPPGIKGIEGICR